MTDLPVTIIRILEYTGTPTEIANNLSQRAVRGESYHNPSIRETFMTHPDLHKVLRISDEMRSEVEQAIKIAHGALKR